jgi:CBS domain-containing protein
MKTVKQLLEVKKTGILSISPDVLVVEALKTMAEHDVGALIVMQDEKLVGIISERDYARKVVLQGRTARDTYVREIMTEKVVSVLPSRTVDECMAVCTNKRIRHLPVIEANRVVGVISIGDLVKETISEQQYIIEQLENYIMH